MPPSMILLSPKTFDSSRITTVMGCTMVIAILCCSTATPVAGFMPLRPTLRSGAGRYTSPKTSTGLCATTTTTGAKKRKSESPRPAVLDDERDLMSLKNRASGNRLSPVSYRDERVFNYYLDDEEDEDDEEDDDYMNEWDLDISGFKELQSSTGSEILQSELQRQIERAQAVSSPDLFLEEHVRDATYLEKVAMSSVTEQLPKAAVQALQNTAAAASSRRKKQDTKRPREQLQSEQETEATSTGKTTVKNAKHVNYVNFAGRAARVTPEQEIILARMIQQGSALQKIRLELEQDLGRPCTRLEWAEAAGLSSKELRRMVSNYRKAKHDLVSANIGLVHAVVLRKYANADNKEELIQEGSLGLLRAAELFDPERGLRFSTYAVVWIKGMLYNSHCNEFVRLPALEKTKWNKIQKAMKDWQATNVVSGGSSSVGGKPSAQELALATHMSVEEVLTTQRHVMATQQLYSLDYEYSATTRSGSDSGTLGSMLEHKTSLSSNEDAELAERTQLRADLLAALARNLDAREARLMRLRYGLTDGRARTTRECAEAMGISQTRVNQLSARCLEKLRQAVEAESLEEYLLTIA